MSRDGSRTLGQEIMIGFLKPTKSRHAKHDMKHLPMDFVFMLEWCQWCVFCFVRSFLGGMRLFGIMGMDFAGAVSPGDRGSLPHFPWRAPVRVGNRWRYRSGETYFLISYNLIYNVISESPEVFEGIATVSLSPNTFCIREFSFSFQEVESRWNICIQCLCIYIYIL